jgi:transposase InsO family protein
MRHSASDKTEIIQLVEQSPWPARRTLEKLSIPKSSFYRWYDRHRRGGAEALADRPSRPDRIWNRIPEAIRSQIVDLALDQPELSPRELAVRFTDEEKYFHHQPSLHRHQGGRTIQGQDHGAQPALADRLHPSQDHGWGWYYLSTVLDDFSRFIVAWKLCATMKVQDVTATLDLALAASGPDHMTVVHRPHLLSDNGSSYVASDLANWLDKQNSASTMRF